MKARKRTAQELLDSDTQCARDRLRVYRTLTVVLRICVIAPSKTLDFCFKFCVLVPIVIVQPRYGLYTAC